MENLKNEIQVLCEISSAVVHQRNVDRLMDEVLDILSRKMGMLKATFTLLQGDVFQIAASHGLDETEQKRGRYHIGEGITGTVAATGQPILVPDILQDKRFLNRTKSHKTTEHIAFLCVPVVCNERVIGTLSIERQNGPGVELEADLKLLEIIGNLTAEAAAIRRQEIQEHEKLSMENERLREAIYGSTGNPGNIIGNCRTMQKVYQQIRQVASTSATVLIRGSSGTGKELVANAIQQLSLRVNKPYITLNCAALPEALVESELFGHERGAFTGADTRRIGRVEAANQGTLFLDEIGDLNPSSQVKLLRFLQERTFSRVGSNDVLKSDVRIIAATSRNLEQLIEEKIFREDLFYRLNVFPIIVPDLCKRRCDIILLAEYFLEKYNIKYNREIRRLSPPAVNMLMDWHWPGNVRELENCIERAVLTAQGDCIYGYDLPPSLQLEEETEVPSNTGNNDVEVDFKTQVDSFERELIVSALKRNQGNMSAAARELKLSPRVIHYQINRLGIKPEWYSVEE